ncbi:MAG TPA: fumarylacetoacetate hydrolase family protein [Steroidobacteraceae bacterium]|nr:fumarylacetoacetate hydrolase family protein [Steroidobacteraceae bacterium]
MNTDTERAARAAALLLAVRRGAPRLAALPVECAPRVAAEAYAIQDAVLAARARGRTRISAWKATLADPSTGTSAPIPESDLLTAPAVIAPGKSGTVGTSVFGIEPEIAFRVGATLEPRAVAYTRGEIATALASAHTAIEICVSRFVDHEAAPPLDHLADAIMNEALVVGPAYGNWQQLDLPKLPVQVRVQGKIVHEAAGGHPLGDPLAPVLWLANHLSRRGLALESGCFVTTGSFNGLRWIPAGQRCEVRFAGLGAAEVRFGD